MSQTWLASGIEIVVILFAAFSGFLVGIAPPGDADARFAVGIGSFVSLIALLLTKALARERPAKRYKRVWIISAIILFAGVIASAFIYKQKYDALTFEYPPGSTKAEHVAGTELTQEAQLYQQEHPGISNAQLLAKYGGLEYKSRVWPEWSLRKARIWLVTSYLTLVLTLSGSIFALTEGALGKAERKKIG
jgi:heme/copper-type cytochrome/quinol oxidase subunit 3